MDLKEIPTQDVIAGANIRSGVTEIVGLSATMRELGLMNPITVREIKHGKYETVWGNRRLEAARSAGLVTIPVVVRQVDETRRLLGQLIENIQRENLTPLDEATAMGRYLELTGEPQNQLAHRLGRPHSYVSNMLTIHRRLTKQEKDILRSMEKQPAKDTLTIAVRTRDPKLRQSILDGEMSKSEAQRAHSQERRRIDGRTKNFSLVVKTAQATVTVVFHKPRVTKAEVVKALEQARTDVADKKIWPPRGR